MDRLPGGPDAWGFDRILTQIERAEKAFGAAFSSKS